MVQPREDSLGTVYLVGAGIGGREGLTLKALKVLQQADVVLVDDLVDPQIFAELLPQVEIIPVGKRGGYPSMAQSEINAHMITACQAGQQVVRLKSGDPWIFGRVVDELEALQAAGCPVVVIPGISSVLAGPEYAGIPLTHKTLSRCIGVITGHEWSTLKWSALAELDTLVIVMGTRTLAEISQQLIQAGRPPETPTALIYKAGYPEQQCWIGSLQTLPQRLPSQSLSPAVIVVGQCVDLKDSLSVATPLPPALPLAGKTVLVTRSDTQASTLTQLLHDQGARVIEMPTIAIIPPSSWTPLDQAIANLKSLDWLILTSANAVTYFFKRLQAQHLDSRSLGGIQIAVVGLKTAAVLSHYGIKPDLVPDEFVADALLDVWPQTTPQKVLFPRVESGGRDSLVKGLRDLNADVIEVAAYQSVCPDHIDPSSLRALTSERVDILTFASSKTVKHFQQLLQAQHFDFAKLAKTTIAAIGPQTAKTCVEVLGRVDRIPTEYTLERLVQVLCDT